MRLFKLDPVDKFYYTVVILVVALFLSLATFIMIVSHIDRQPVSSAASR